MLFDYQTHPGRRKWTSVFFSLLSKTILSIFHKVTVIIPDGAEIIKEGPVFLLIKHSSNLDVPHGIVVMRKVFGRTAWCIIKASLARPLFMGLFWKAGGLPLDRDDPRKSKDILLFGRKVLYERDINGLEAGDGNMMALFPEQSRYMGVMGEGQAGAFRFLTGKPAKPLPVYSVGITYKKRPLRNEIVMTFSQPHFYEKSTNPAKFLHERMVEMAKLSGLEYNFPAP